MTIPYDPELELFAHIDLIAMVHALLVSVNTLEKENQRLREKIESNDQAISGHNVKWFSSARYKGLVTDWTASLKACGPI